MPDADDAARFAAIVRAAVVPPGGDGRLTSFRGIARRGRFRVSSAPLAGARGQLEGLLVPLPDDRFGVCVDPAPRGGWRQVEPILRRDLRRHRTRFRVAHEVAHSFFYHREAGCTPRRTLRETPEQEQFCDEFARALLVDRATAKRVDPTPLAVFQIQRRFDVSLELAARAIAASQPQVSMAVFFWRHDQAGPLQQWSTSPLADWRGWEEELRRVAARARRSGATSTGAGFAYDARRRQAVVVAT